MDKQESLSVLLTSIVILFAVVLVILMWDKSRNMNTNIIPSPTEQVREIPQN